MLFSHKINVRNKYIVLVDGDVASDVVDSYMTWIACMLREIELMALSGVHLYRLYRYNVTMDNWTVYLPIQ